MNYMISRDDGEFGPYTLGDLQRYVASGDILLSDMARSEGMTGYLPVSQVVGSIPVPTAIAPISLAPGIEYPDPPNLPWWLVLIFEIVTRGLFGAGWGLALAFWIRRFVPRSKAVYYYGGYALCWISIFLIVLIARGNSGWAALLGLIFLVTIVLNIASRFSLRNSLEQHYNSNEQMGLALSGVMTFFFGTIYFQYHLNDIVRRKKLERISLAA